MRSSRIVFPICALLATSSGTGHQERLPDEETRPGERIVEVISPGLVLRADGTYKRFGPAIPKYFVVVSFLERARFCRSVPFNDGEAWLRLLERLSIAASTQQEETLKWAIETGLEIDSRKADLFPYRNDPEKWREVQTGNQRQRAIQLREMWDEFQAVLSSGGYNLPILEDFLESEILPEVEMVSFPTPDSEMFEIMVEEFENYQERPE